MDDTQPGWACASHKWERRRFAARGKEAQEKDKRAREEKTRRKVEKTAARERKITRKTAAVRHGGDFFTDSGEFLHRCAILNEGQP
jgi:hypothetical protein